MCLFRSTDDLAFLDCISLALWAFFCAKWCVISLLHIALYRVRLWSRRLVLGYSDWSWLAYIHPMCSSTRSYSPHNFNLKLIIKAVQIVDSNKITHMIRCAWNASSMYAAFRIMPQPNSDTTIAPYYVKKVDFDKNFQRKEWYRIVLKIKYCEGAKNAKIQVIMTF